LGERASRRQGLPSAGSVARATVVSRPVVRHAASAVIFAGLAALVAIVGRAYGGYDIAVWAPLGIGLLAGAGGLVAAGVVPMRAIGAAAGALVLLGVWSVLSVAWGGLPGHAWTALNQSLLAAAAIMAGSVVASVTGMRRLVPAAVLAGVVAHAAEIVVRLGLGEYPDEWFFRRFLEGPVGYHNAQAAFFALGIPLALAATTTERALVRLAGGVAAGLLAGGLLLTQSRGALAALLAALLVQLLWSRDLRLFVRASLLVTAGVALLFALRSVDAAIVEGTTDEQLDALRNYALATGAAALALGALFAPSPPRIVTRALAAGLAAALVVAALVLGVSQRDAVARVDGALATLASDVPPKAAAGSTRLANLSLNGRREAWRVAREMTAETPVTGAGQGQFARRWTTDRRVEDLYIVQPHSLELELLSELGAVGLGLFAVFGLLVAVALVRSPDRVAAAAAAGVLVVIVGQASVDWTWSFPGLVAPALLVAGSAAPGERRGLGWPARGLVLVALLAAIASLAGPYLADRLRDRADDLQRTNATVAWRHTEEARKLNPWDPAIVSLQGRLAEAVGEFRRSAERYRAAADLSQRPWLEYFREARALARAGARSASLAACRRAAAENPREKLLRREHCEDAD
jgi:hypothetical protein